MNPTVFKNKEKTQEQIIEILQKQNGHPIHSVQIGDRINISGSQVDDMVLELRSLGFTICGDDAHAGYWFGTLAEVKKTIDDLKDKVKLEELVIKMWEHRLKMDIAEQQEKTAGQGEELPGQQSMDL